MIYLVKDSTTEIIGSFDTISLAKTYLTTHGITDHSDYIYTRRIEDMSYISKICYVDDVCIYNNKDFWLNSSHDVSNDFDTHTVIDMFGEVVDKNRFDIEMNNNCLRLNNIYNTSDEVAYNIKIGFEFISLFRQECIGSDLGAQSGLGIAQSTANVIPLVITGSFREACVLLSIIPIDDYFTTDKLTKYISMLTAADVIVYQ